MIAVLIAVLAVVGFVAGAAYGARALLLPPLPKSVRKGWRPDRRD